MPFKGEEILFVDWFDDCGGEGNYIGPGATRCTDILTFNRRNNGWEIWTFYGVDDLGNEVTGEGRVDLI